MRTVNPNSLNQDNELDIEAASAQSIEINSDSLDQDDELDIEAASDSGSASASASAQSSVQVQKALDINATNVSSTDSELGIDMMAQPDPVATQVPTLSITQKSTEKNNPIATHQHWENLTAEFRLHKVSEQNNYKNPIGDKQLSETLELLREKLNIRIAKFQCTPAELENKCETLWQNHKEKSSTKKKLNLNQIPAKQQEQALKKYEEYYKQTVKEAYEMYKGMQLHPKDSSNNIQTITMSRSTKNPDGTSTQATININYVQETDASSGEGINKILFSSEPADDKNAIDLLIESAMHTKKILKNPHEYTFVIRPSNNKEALKELFLKAQKYDLNPKLVNYPSTDAKHFKEDEFSSLQKDLQSYINPIKTPKELPTLKLT